MKKKIAALLTAALVLTMSTATVFAAESPSKGGVTVKSDGVAGATDVVAATTTLGETEKQSANEALSDVLDKVGKVKNHEVTAIVDITGTVTPGQTATVTVTVSGINAGNKVIVLHYLNGAWQQEDAYVDANGNVVITGLEKFSPFMFVKYTEKTGLWYYDPAIDGPQEQSATSPKTGVLPVAAMTAGICLAGAAICGKKVKFN